MKIPKQFKLFGQTIFVEYKDKLVNDDDAVGRAVYRESKIFLQKQNNGITRTREMIEQCFLHELLHFIFHLSGEKELEENEKFIDIISSLFHQYIVSQEGELEL